MKFRTGVVVGKFYPFHRGHQFLMETALAQAEQVTVIVCHKKDEHSIPGEIRGKWIRETLPSARVLVIDDVYGDDDSELWAKLTIEWLGGAPEAVFTSEDYGDRYAAFMGAVHVKIDQARIQVPCSGTAIRNDPFAHWNFLGPAVKAWFAKRVCVLGAESTGTTTLARALAERLQTAWVREYGREYSETKQARGESVWTEDEFLVIAREQCRREDEAARVANRVLICDTNAFATRLWFRRYMGFDSAKVEAIAAERHYDLYLLTGDEIPFVQDGLRDGEHIRHRMQQWFVEALKKQRVPWVLLEGSRETRLERALEKVGALFSKT